MGPFPFVGMFSVITLADGPFSHDGERNRDLFRGKKAVVGDLLVIQVFLRTEVLDFGLHQSLSRFPPDFQYI